MTPAHIRLAIEYIDEQIRQLREKRADLEVEKIRAQRREEKRK